MALRHKLNGMTRFTLAAVVGALAYTCTADAVQTANTPNAAFISYNLAGGAATTNYNPIANVSTSVMANCTTEGVRGVGQVTLMKVTPATFIEWVGLHSTPNATITHGYSSVEGTHILQLSYNADVWLEIGTAGGANANNRDTIRIHNESGGVRAGNMTWVW